MLGLSNSDLVEILPNRGFRVMAIDDQDLDEICALRILLEVPAMELVVRRALDAGLDLLYRAIAELELATERRDVPAFLMSDREFHLELLVRPATGGWWRSSPACGIRPGWGVQQLAASGALQATAAEQRPILEAVRRRDADAARRLMTVHLEHMRGTWAQTRTWAS